MNKRNLGAFLILGAVGAAIALSLLLQGGEDEAAMRQPGHSHEDPAKLPAGATPPSLTLTAHKDTASGYNLQIEVANFRFSPERTGQEADGVEGHAHLYVNGDKIGRVYGVWLHLPGTLLQDGENEVTVTLNDNQHHAWVDEDGPVAATIRLQHDSDAAAGHQGHGAGN